MAFEPMEDAADLVAVLAALDTPQEVGALLEDLYTVREVKEISQRLAVAQLLSEGRSYASIESATGASATTIARVSKCLSSGAGGYRSALEVLRREDGDAGEDSDACD